MLQGIKAGLETVGWKPEVHELAWFQDDYGLKVDGGDEDGAEDDDEDDEDDDDAEDDEEEGSEDFELVDGKDSTKA